MAVTDPTLVHAQRSIHCQDDIYIDELVTYEDKICIMSRMKGSTLGTAEIEAQKHDMTLFESSEDLFNGKRTYLT